MFSWVFGFPVISSILLTIIRQNIGILSNECKWDVFVNVSISFRFCVRRLAHCRAFWKQGLSRIILSRIFFSFSCSRSYSRRFFITSLPSGVIVVGSCLLLRSFTASQCNISMKLYSSAAFLTLWPQGLQTRFDKFSFLVCNGEPQQSEPKSAPQFQLCPTAKINFQMRLVLPQKWSNSTKSTTSVFF